MTPLDDEIRRHLDRRVNVDTLEPNERILMLDAIRTQVTTPRHATVWSWPASRWFGAAASGLAVILVAALVIRSPIAPVPVAPSSFRSAQGTAGAVPTTSTLAPPAVGTGTEPTPAASPPVTALRWSVEPFLPESAAQPAAITEVGSRLIVTGSDEDGRRPIDSAPAAWYSDDDGVTWDSASIIGDDADRRPQALGSVAGNDDLLLSLGWVYLGGGNDANRQSVLWASTDRGVTWERITGDAVPPRLHDLAAGGPGFVAVGNANPSNSGLPDLDPPHAAVWVSADGLEWERIDEAGFQLARMNAITERDGLLVAAGSQRVGEDGRPAIWRSLDGRQWSRVELSASPGAVRSVAGDPDLFVAVGGSIQEGTVVWLSPDGLTWTAQVLDPMPGGRATGVAVNGIGFVAIGTSAQTAGGLGSVWFAPVGGAASPQTVRAYMYDVVGAGNRFVGLGTGCGPQTDCLVSHFLVIGRPVAP